MNVLIVIIALVLGINDDGSKKGRKGNESYRDNKHEEAVNLYREGIDATGAGQAGKVVAGLWNNLGASLFRLGSFDQAKEAFSNALAFATSNDEVSDFAYNTGNTIYSASQNAQQPGAPDPTGAQPPASSGGGAGTNLQEALEYYKRAMLADPENEDAKFNYEFVKRQLDDQEQNQDQEQQENEDQQQNDQEQNQDQEQQNEQEQNQDQQQQSQEQNEDQQQQNQEQNQDQQQQEQQQEQQSEPDPTKLSREEAERILQALQNEEEELLREVMKPQTRPKKVEKDW